MEKLILTIINRIREGILNDNFLVMVNETSWEISFGRSFDPLKLIDSMEKLENNQGLNLKKFALLKFQQYLFLFLRGAQLCFFAT